MTHDVTKPDAYATLPAADPAGALRLLYDKALTQARLPYRSPTHRIAEELRALSQAAAYATALALLTGEYQWRSTATRLKHDLAARERQAQSDMNQAERDQGRLRRYGMGHLP